MAGLGPPGGGQPAKPGPVERRPGVGLAFRCDGGMTGDVLDRIAAREGSQQSRKDRVLPDLVGQVVGAFELDADREIVAMRASAETRYAGVPRALVARHELHEPTVATHEKVCGDVQMRDRRIIRMRRGVETIGEQPRDSVPAELSRRCLLYTSPSPRD